VVLIVEDEPLLRYTTSEFLQLSGYGVLMTPSAAEAAALLETGQSVSVVVSDVQVSGVMDGLALVRWLRVRYPNLPVILTSGYGNSIREAAIEAVGRDHFLSKPYRQQELANRIRCLVRGPPILVGSLHLSN
jgi:CheY-like chemotaxis protein